MTGSASSPRHGTFRDFRGFHELEKNERVDLIKTKIKNLLPTREDWRQSTGPILRGSVLASFGNYSGGGGIIATSWPILWKNASPNTGALWEGEIAGVAGPNRQTMLRPEGPLSLLSLGIP